jgi:WD40 repeat protein
MSSIFISYSRKDLAIAEKIVSALAESNLDTWIDWKSIPKGEKFEQEIYQGIEGANVFLFLISPESVQSEWCKKEVVHATKNSKRIIPILIQDADNDSIPLGVSERNWIFCRENQDDFGVAIKEILKTIHADYEWVKYQTKLQTKALDWERRKDNSRLLRGKELQEAEQQLASAGSKKDPQPTDLQRQFVEESRNIENLQTAERKRTRERLRNRALTIGGITIIAIIAAILALLFGGQVGIARFGEQQALATATVASGIAQAESTRATEQSLLKLAQQLASQANSMRENPVGYFEQSTLLAIESYRIAPNAEANEIIWKNLPLFPLPLITRENSYAPLAFSPDGKYIASQGMSGELQVWEVASGRKISSMKFKINHETITSIAFNPDGNWIASGTYYDNTARVWDVTTGREISHMTHNEAVHSVAFSPDGKWIVSGSGDENGTAIVWDASTGRKISELSREFLFQGGISSVAFSPDGQWVISAAQEGPFMVSSNSSVTATKYPDRVVGIVYVWEASTGEEIARMMHDDVINAIAISPNGEWVVSGSNDRTARVWEAATGKEISRMAHESFVNAVSFSPDGNWVVSGGSDNTVRIWNAATGGELLRKSHADSVISVAFTPDGKSAISGSSDGITRVWNATSGAEVVHLIGSTGVVSPNGKIAATSYKFNVWVWPIESDINQEVLRINQVGSSAFSSDNKTIAVGGTDFQVWDIVAGQKILQDANAENVSVVAFSPDGKWLASAGKDLQIWDVDTGQEVTRIKYTAGITSVAFSPDGGLIVSGGNDNTVRVWDVTTGKEIARMTHEVNDEYRVEEIVSAVAFSPDGNFVVSGGFDRTVRIWEVNTGKEVTRMTLTEPCSSVAFNPNGNLVAAGDWFGNVYILDLSSRKKTNLRNGIDWEAIVVFSPDGRWIASSGGSNNSANIWNVSTGNVVVTLTHSDIVVAVAFSHNGKFVVSGSYDGTARIWDIATGSEIARISQPNRLSFVDFSSNDKWIVIESIDNTTRVWLWQIEDAITSACERLPRNLTLEEWKQYFGDKPYKATCPNLPTPTE